jgi:hypothetical protein
MPPAPFGAERIKISSRLLRWKGDYDELGHRAGTRNSVRVRQSTSNGHLYRAGRDAVCRGRTRSLVTIGSKESRDERRSRPSDSGRATLGDGSIRELRESYKVTPWYKECDHIQGNGHQRRGSRQRRDSTREDTGRR